MTRRCQSRDARLLSAEALLASVVDYAGLFPPAALSMADAAAEYHRALTGPDAWMLGRFVVPATQLAALVATLADTPVPPAPWRLSAIVRDASDDDRRAIEALDARRSDGRVLVDAVETKPATPAGLDWLAGSFGPGLDIYVEVAPGPEVETWFAQLAALGLRAKVRTGGLTADAFPDPAPLAALLAAAVRHGVPLKATAGLHHVVRGTYRLTYAPDALSAPMYGYLNVLLAFAVLHGGGAVADAEAMLCANDVTALSFTDEAIRWNRTTISAASIRAARARHLVSFGSCSFREPVEEFAALAAARSSSS